MDVPLWVRFTATERRETGAAHRVLIEPSLDDPCTAVCTENSNPDVVMVEPAEDGL
jgi:hypothetical protein